MKKTASSHFPAAPTQCVDTSTRQSESPIAQGGSAQTVRSDRGSSNRLFRAQAPIRRSEDIVLASTARELADPAVWRRPHFKCQSTVASNPALPMALQDGSSLNIAGSIAHGSTMRVFRASNGGSLSDRGCLLTHPLQSDASLLGKIAPGVFSEGTTQNDPALSPHFIPTPASIALDGCSLSRGDGGLDFFNQNRNIELLGVINFPFPNLEPSTYVVDLGAIELRDLGPVFKDGFEGT